MFFLRLLVGLQLICIIQACFPFSYHWEGWSSCSESCGGGTRHRTEYSCVLSERGDTQHQDCNTFCHNGHPYSGGSCRCPSWRSGRCCDMVNESWCPFSSPYQPVACRDTHMAHCKPGRYACGGSPDRTKCTDCQDPYYSGGYGRGCLACPPISECHHRHCTNPGNNKCIECNDDNVFFKRTEHDTKCERLCAWNNHQCWPGKCSDDLTKHCQCDSGFRRVNTNGETSCQPTQKPKIETCRTTFVGSNGEKKQSSSSNSSSTACEFLQDVYGNFQVTSIQYDMFAALTIHVSNITIPSYIRESNFGVTDSTVYLKKNLPSGRESEIQRKLLMEDRSNSKHAKQIYSNKGDISTSASTYSLQNGDWLCVMYECLGGGYLIGINTRGFSHVDLEPTPYQKTSKTKKICYRYDDAAPVHCLAMNTCKDEPVYVTERVSKSQELSVSFQNWFDPIPNSGDNSRASLIESYRITLHETIPSKDKVQVDTGNVFTRIVNANETSIDFLFNKTEPMLYCIVLEVKDVADNVKQARRFFLYDNSSYIELDQINPLYVKSASASTNFTWQTHHNEICLDWKDHFLNKYYLDNQFLNPIEPDRLGLISGVYDQIDGLLPVSGTENVHGVVKFEYFWNLNNGTLSNGTTVTNLTNQAFCKDFDLTDGQTYIFKIIATDVARNQLEDETTLYIDRSVPHIKNIWQQKGDNRSVFVHDSKELSTMVLYFEALDPHSGILNLEWTFGMADSEKELRSGVIRPDKFKDASCSSTEAQCYCPKVGNCQLSSFTIPLKTVVGRESNLDNGSYVFAIKATNHALLSNNESIEIFINESILEEVSSTHRSDTVGLVVGSVTGVGGFVIVIVLIVLLVFKIRKRKAKQNESDKADIATPESNHHGKSSPRQEDNGGVSSEDDRAGYSNIEWNPYEQLNRSDTSRDYESLRLPNEYRLKHADNALYMCQARDSVSNPYENIELENRTARDYKMLHLTEESLPSVAVYENLKLRCPDKKTPS